MPKTILVVDDNVATVEKMKYILEKNGYAVVTAFNGKEGYDQAVSIKPDAILLDIMMPVMDGLTMNKELKADPHTRGIPVLIISARSGTAPLFQTETGAPVQGYLIKPVRTAILMDALESLFKQQA